MESESGTGIAEPMKIALIVVAVVIIAASFYADYKWRQWMAARRRERR